MDDRKGTIEKLQRLAAGEISLNEFLPGKTYRFLRGSEGLYSKDHRRYFTDKELKELERKNPNSIFIIQRIIGANNQLQSIKKYE
jgi:hypothetical protein